MELKASNGPWSDVFRGNLEGFDYETKINNSGLLVSLIYEKNGNGISGVIAEVFKVLYAKGDVLAFLRHIPKRTMLISLHTEEKTHQFMLIDSGSEYIPYDERAVTSKVDALISRVASLSGLLKQVSAAYDTDLLEIEQCDEDTKKAFFTLPLVNLIVAPITKKVSRPEVIELSHGEIHFGITKAGTTVKEPFDFFERTLVFGGSWPERAHVLHVLAESAMLSNLPLVIIDWEDAFRGLHYPNPKEDELKKYKAELDAVGFPIKIFKAGEELKAAVEHIDANALIELFGIGNTIVAQVIIETFKRGNFKTFDELKKRVMDVEETPKITSFKKREAQRIFELLEDIYPEFFSDGIPLEEITKKWSRNISRANILLFSKDDLRKNMLALQVAIKALKKYFSEKGQSDKLKAVLIFTAANTTIPKFKSNYINRAIASDLAEMVKYGCGLIVETADRINVSDDITKLGLSTIGIIAGNDIAVVIENRKNYRVFLRPGLSNCCAKPPQ